MADYSIYYAKRKLDIDAIGWTTIVPPIACRYIGVRNITNVNVLLRSDVSNASSEDTIAAGDQEVIGSSYPHGPRFPAGVAVAALQSATGAQTVMITYVR